jgi:hypothetical protein
VEEDLAPEPVEHMLVMAVVTEAPVKTILVVVMEPAVVRVVILPTEPMLLHILLLAPMGLMVRVAPGVAVVLVVVVDMVVPEVV